MGRNPKTGEKMSLAAAIQFRVVYN